jgi:hypothetical protein
MSDAYARIGSLHREFINILMKMREIMSIVEDKKSAWTTFLVIGSFTEPTTGKNFIVVRIPKGRVPWSRKIVPAINQIVKEWFTEEMRQADKHAKRREREKECKWHVEGEDEEDTLWYLKQSVARYEWSGEMLVKVDQPVKT